MTATATATAPKAKKTAATKGNKEKPAVKIGVDKFGCRIGTDRAKINAALSKKPQSMADLMKKAGVETPKGNHLRGLEKQGVVARDDDGNWFVKK